MEFAQKLESEVPDPKSRWGVIQSICAHVLVGEMPLHMATRKIPGKGENNDKWQRNNPGRTFRRDYQPNYRGVNCAEF